MCVHFFNLMYYYKNKKYFKTYFYVLTNSSYFYDFITVHLQPDELTSLFGCK